MCIKFIEDCNLITNNAAEQDGPSGNASVMFGRCKVPSKLSHQLSCLKFLVVVLIVSRQMLVLYLSYTIVASFKIRSISLFTDSSIDDMQFEIWCFKENNKHA